ncbi:MAG TPA: hypothetical protein VE553_03150 [Candidatus Binatia bacterium]|jgi:hypothetical protein|nr:hypothetical protein [Candidatus Binatia bacterium]
MDFTVQRTAPEAAEPPTYILRDAHGSALLQADQSHGPPPESRRQIRLARTNGKLVATIDLPQSSTASADQEQRVDYAIIHDYAVYAIISVHRRPAADGSGGAGAYYVLEVEGETWLVLPHAEEDACYAFYDEVPAGLHTYDTLTELDLPPNIGRICRNGDDSALFINLEPLRLEHTDLVVLALALLLDQSDSAA